MIKSVDDKLDAKERKRQDRFNGLTEEEVALRTLPDHLAPNLDIIIVRQDDIHGVIIGNNVGSQEFLYNTGLLSGWH